MINIILTAGLTLLSLVGFSQIDGSFYENYTHKWEVYLEDSNGNKSLSRVWTDYGETMEISGKKYLHHVQDLYNPDGSLYATWINMVEHKSLKPWYFQSVTPTGIFTFTKFLENKAVTISSNPIEKEYKRDTMVYTGRLYDWNLYGILLCGLPMEPGIKYSLPIFNPNTLSIDQIDVNITQKEKIKTKTGKSIETWKVETDKNLTFWLSKIPPYVVQLKLDLQNGNKLWWYSCY